MLIRALRFSLLVAVFSVASAQSASQRWELGVAFLGAEESAEYQQDIDANVLELARVSPSARLRLAIYREFPDRDVLFVPDPQSDEEVEWDALFSQSPIRGLKVPGRIQVWKHAEGLLRNSERLQEFYRAAFSRQPKGAKRLLQLYAHGFATGGVRGATLRQLREALEQAPRLDLVWLDSCYMASVEVAFELRGVAPLLIASEDAEFSAGAPFEALQEIEGRKDARELAVELARRFLESYSYLQSGSQRRAVETSSATIAVIDTERLESSVADLGAVAAGVRALDPDSKKALARATRSIRLEKPELVDLGSYLRLLERSTTLPTEESLQALVRLLEMLERDRTSRLKTSPRVTLYPPHEDTYLIYGYEDWTRGYEGDESAPPQLDVHLRPDAYFDGPGNHRWPAVRVHKRFSAAPFAVGLTEFNAAFWDPLGKEKPEFFRLARTTDVQEMVSRSDANPILYSGYTHGVGRSGERYTGLNVLDPTQNAATVDYVSTEFFRATSWVAF